MARDGMKGKMSLSDARILATGIVNQLSTFCQRIEIAGSVRRAKPEVGDIEIVAIPHFGVDMFGDATAEHLLDTVEWDGRFGKVIKGGHKYKQIELYTGVNLDLFIVVPPAQWGVIFAIRTGSAEFSHRLVTSRKFGGLMPSNFSVRDGAVWSNNHIIETPEEEDLFSLFGIPFIVPQERVK